MGIVLEQELESVIEAPKKSSLLKKARKELSFALGSTAFLWQVLFFYAPLLILLSSGFFKFTESGKFASLTLEYFKPVFHYAYISTIFNSLALSTTTTLFCLFFGFTLAYCMKFHGGRLKNFFLFLLLIPFWTNFILHIYAWFFLLEKHGFLNTLLLQLGLIQSPLHFLNTYFATFVMMVYFYLPFMILPIYASLDRFDTALLEASLDLGANKRQTISKILLPLIMNGIRAGVYLVFIPAFGEFVIPELMGGDRDFFIGNVISLFMLGEKASPIGIAFTLVSMVFLGVALVSIHFLINYLSKRLSGVRKW